jgi:ribonucleoside-diphosphate reductase alpha chain
VIHSKEFGRVKMFLTLNFYADGRPGELFVTCDQSGTTLDGAMDAWSTALSMLLQHGESLEDLAGKFAGQEWEPKGPCEGLAGQRWARSPVDLAVRWAMERVGRMEEGVKFERGKEEG